LRRQAEPLLGRGLWGRAGHRRDGIAGL